MSVWRWFVLFVRTLPARIRARRLGLFFVPCPVCRRPFGADEVMHTPGGPACLMNSPGGGMLVCKDCQERAKQINRQRWGRDLSDPYPPGVRL